MFEIKGEPQEVLAARKRVLTEFADLEFQEEGHLYFLNGKQLPSVSTIGHRFESHPFDKEKQSVRMAEKNGRAPEYYLKQWQCNAFRAATLGTKTHEFGESLAYLRAGHPELIRESMRTQYLEEEGYLAPIHPKEEAIERFLDEMNPSLHLVLNETKVYSGKNPDASMNLKEQICGTFDMLYWYDGNGNPEKAGFVVLDYKTNRSLQNDYSRKFGRMLLPPFNDYFEEDLGLYTIQLNLYALMLEDIGLHVIGRRIVWLRDDATYSLIPVDDISDRLRSVL